MTKKISLPICKDISIVKKELEKVLKSIPNESILKDLSNIYKVFGDPTRLKIIFALRYTELCVKHLSEVVDMEQSVVSHHLRNLRNAKLVKTKREGKNIIYSLDDDHVTDILDIGYKHVTE